MRNNKKAEIFILLLACLVLIIVPMLLIAQETTTEPSKPIQTTIYTQENFKSSQKLIRALEDKVKKLEQEQKCLRQDIQQWSGMWKQLFPKGGN